MKLQLCIEFYKINSVNHPCYAPSRAKNWNRLELTEVTIARIMI